MLTLAKQATDRVVERLRDWLSGDADYRWLPENGESVFDVINHMIAVEVLADKRRPPRAHACLRQGSVSGGDMRATWLGGRRRLGMSMKIV